MPAVVMYAVTLIAVAIIAWLIVRNRHLQRENTVMRDRMTEVEHMKKNFISHVSHEL